MTTTLMSQDKYIHAGKIYDSSSGKYHLNKTIIISGNLVSSQFGNLVTFSLHHPDGVVEDLGSTKLPSNGFFNYPIIGIDKYFLKSSIFLSLSVLSINPSP